jgi:actin-related protein 2
MAHIIACDNGTGYLKIGPAGTNIPEYCIPCLIGRCEADETFGDITVRKEMLCDEVTPVRSMLNITYPVSEGIVRNWEDMTKVWSYAFSNKMHLDTSDTKVLLTEAPLNPLKNREKMYEVMFETLGFAAAKVEVQATLALLGQGLMDGVVLDSGDGVTHCIPIMEGTISNHAIQRLNLAGRHMTEYLVKLLLIRGYAFNLSADFETVREIKERTCYCSCNLELDRRIAKEATVLDVDYQLPDKTWIKIGRERFEATEALFQPYLLGREDPGVSELVFKTIMQSPMDSRPKLFPSIFLSGGSTMYPGLPNRLERDLRHLHREMRKQGETTRFKIKVHDFPYRKYLVYIGASTVAKIWANESSVWKSKYEWEEDGAQRVARRP